MTTTTTPTTPTTAPATSPTTSEAAPTPRLDVAALHTACDRLVATAPDPAATRLLLLRMWALGAASTDTLLADLVDVAAHTAARTGREASAAELLDALGHHQHALALLEATAYGLVEHAQTTEAKDRAALATQAARAALRLTQVDQHRRAGAPTSAPTASHAA